MGHFDASGGRLLAHISWALIEPSSEPSSVHVVSSPLVNDCFDQNYYSPLPTYPHHPPPVTYYFIPHDNIPTHSPYHTQATPLESSFAVHNPTQMTAQPIPREWEAYAANALDNETVSVVVIPCCCFAESAQLTSSWFSFTPQEAVSRHGNQSHPFQHHSGAHSQLEGRRADSAPFHCYCAQHFPVQISRVGWTNIPLCSFT